MTKNLSFMVAMNISDASDLIEALGEAVLVSELGFTSRLIRHSRSSGFIAANRYLQVKKACDDRGIPCPVELFSFKPAEGVSDKSSVNKAQKPKQTVSGAPQ